MNLQDYQTFLQTKLTERSVLTNQFGNKEKEIISLKDYYEKLIKARWVLAEVSRLTQQKVSSYIESLVTMAIQSIYQDDFVFHCNFDIKRNKSECLLTVSSKEGKEFIPKDEDGGGILDVISLALRIVLWTMQKPRSINTFILDEPGKFLGDLIESFGLFIKEISNKLNIQFIINTHDPRLSEIADRVWTVTKKDGISIVKQEGEDDLTLKKKEILKTLSKIKYKDEGEESVKITRRRNVR